MDTILDTHRKNEPLPFVTLDGSPTITFTTAAGRTLLDYFSATEARFNPRATEIVIFTTDYLITIAGHELEPVWEGLKLKSIHEITVSPPGDAEAVCRVTSIIISPQPLSTHQNAKRTELSLLT